MLRHRRRRHRCWYPAVACRPWWRTWLLHGPLTARLLVVALALALLFVFGVAIDRMKLVDVVCYAFAELAAKLVGEG